MKKNNYSTLLLTALLLIFFISLKSFAVDYNINFTGTGASTTVGSVIVQNLTKGTTVTVTDGNALILNVTPNSINSLNADKENLCIFPNPSQGKSTVSFIAKQEGNSLIDVFGIDGKKLVGAYKNLQAGENSFILTLPKGIFAIWVTGNGYSYTGKAISQSIGQNNPEIKFTGDDIVKTSVPQKTKSVVASMPYTVGDQLLYKGTSGNYSTIVTDVPTASKTINFDFVFCADADGNNYKVVKIGTQTWMAENLKTTRYRTGEAIGTTTPATLQMTQENPPIHQWYQWAFDGDENNVAKYGRLYTFYAAVDNRNIAPTGWHVPTDAE